MNHNSSGVGGNGMSAWGGDSRMGMNEELWRSAEADELMDLDDTYGHLGSDGGAAAILKSEPSNGSSVSLPALDSTPHSSSIDPSTTTALVPHRAQHGQQQIPFSGSRTLPFPTTNHVWSAFKPEISGLSSSSSTALVHTPNSTTKWGSTPTATSLNAGGSLPPFSFAYNDPSLYLDDTLPPFNMHPMTLPSQSHHYSHNSATDYTPGSPDGLYVGSFSSAGAGPDLMGTMGLNDDESSSAFTQPDRHHSHSLSGGSGFDTSPLNDWLSSADDSIASTVSPKMLRIAPSPSPPTPADSVNNSFVFGCTESEAGSSQTPTLQHEPAASSPKVLAPKPVRPRKQLPGSSRSSSRTITTTKSHGTSRTRSSATTAEATADTPASIAESTIGVATTSYSSSSSTRPTRASKTKTKSKGRPLRPISSRKRAAAEAAMLEAEERASSPDVTTPISFAADIASPPAKATAEMVTSLEAAEARVESERARKDEFLLSGKKKGMTYKEIRRKGGFTEAESTLRGRYRTLTKSKDERVRKPEWEDKDDRLLRTAVRKLSGGDPAMTKVPWKQVAEYIVEHGGSYHFGNTTCRKRWDLLYGGGSQD